MPPPVIVAVFTIFPVAASGAYGFTSASYTITALPPAGTVIPFITSGGPAVAAGAGCNTPLI